MRGDLEVTDRLAHSKRHCKIRPEIRHIMEPSLRNPARERLETGELALGVGIRQSRRSTSPPIMKACGYDWLFLDLDHNSMDLAATRPPVSAIYAADA